jgi:hypothetical protein
MKIEKHFETFFVELIQFGINLSDWRQLKRRDEGSVPMTRVFVQDQIQI